MHSNSKLLFQKYAKQYFRTGLKVLEVGPDGIPSTYQNIVGDPSVAWHTLDIRSDPALTYQGSSEYEFPIDTGVYDIVLSGQVLEHVRQIWVWIREVARVCKVGGLVVTINPVSWPYHEAPVDCWRAFPEGMKALYEYASLQVELSAWECLEPVPSRRRLPGSSAQCQSLRRRLAYRVLGLMGFPAECAYDTITIGQKTAETGNLRQVRH
jgi:SAM-dependent methyltransferase